MNKKGFTLIELLVVIAIIGLLSTLAVVSLSSARAKARDAQRLSDVKQMSSVIESEEAQGPSTAITCGAAHLANTCTAPGEISQFSRFNDPVGTAGCTDASTAECEYSIYQQAGGAAPTTDDYQICFFLEQPSGSLAAGLNRVASGGIMTALCDTTP